jgi:hypothetical protein
MDVIYDVSEVGVALVVVFHLPLALFDENLNMMGMSCLKEIHRVPRLSGMIQE